MSKLPLGPTLYSKDSVSEQPERFFVSELIREKIFFLYDKEVPYSSQVLHRGQGGSGSMWGHGVQGCEVLQGCGVWGTGPRG